MAYNDATVLQVRERIEKMDECLHKYAFMYQFLIAGEISEICGKYAPSEDYFIETEIEVMTRGCEPAGGESTLVHRFN